MENPVIRTEVFVNEALVNAMYQTLREFNGISNNKKRLSAPFVAGLETITLMVEPPLAALYFIFRIGENLSGSLYVSRRCSLKRVGIYVEHFFIQIRLFFTRALLVIPVFIYQTSVILYDPNDAYSFQVAIDTYSA